MTIFLCDKLTCSATKIVFVVPKVSAIRVVMLKIQPMLCATKTFVSFAQDETSCRKTLSIFALQMEQLDSSVWKFARLGKVTAPLPDSDAAVHLPFACRKKHLFSKTSPVQGLGLARI